LIEGKENNNLSNLTSAPHACASSPENLDDASTRPSPDELLRIPSNLIPSLTCRPCPQLFILLDMVFVVGLPILSLNESREVDVLVSSYMTGRRLFSSEECLVFILLTT
jgi:hypothetical protein